MQNALSFLYNQTNYETSVSIPYEELEKNLLHIREFLRFIGDPQKKYPIVHVAGTKGKGSVCMMLEQILRRAGYRTGLFTSPHLISLYERFAVEGSPCSEEEFNTILLQIKSQWEEFCGLKAIKNRSLTFFEWSVLFAFEYFARKNVGIVLLETGLGGRFDATNVCDPVLSIITSISFDHQAQLGSTLREIAYEKAGIIKPDTPIISGVLSALDIPQNSDYSENRITKSNIEEARKVIADTAQKYSAPLHELEDVPEISDPELPLCGRHQSWNLAIVLTALNLLSDKGFSVDMSEIRSALIDLYLPSRIEILSQTPLFIVDGAHNRTSAAALCDTLRTKFFMKPIAKKILLFGASREKDVEGMFMEFLTFFDEIRITQYEGPRAIPAEELYKTLTDLIQREKPEKVPVLRLVSEFEQEILSILTPKKLSSSPLYCVSGSFYLAARAASAFHQYTPKKSCSIISLGCPKNHVDSESMIGRLIAFGYRFQEDPENVDLLILNTCGFLQAARDEAFDWIRDLIEMKKQGRIRCIAVAGCLIKAQGESLSQTFPEVDFWFSPFDENRIAPVLDNISKPEIANPISIPIFLSAKDVKFPHQDEQRRILTAPHVAYLKIADGCDRFCSYCSIPSIRGRYISKSKEAILDEARRMADAGVRELVLIAQETTFWGSDLYGQPRLAELLAEIKDQKNFDWIRVLYTYPLFFSDELIALFNGGGRKKRENEQSIILPYIDIPLQHCNNEILKKMNRKTGKEETEDLLARLREGIEDLVLRTTFILGFPGETEKQFSELIDFVKKWKFERAGQFLFSPEPGTRAALLPDQIPDSVKIKRQKKFAAVLKKLTEKFAQSRIGSVLDIMIDECSLKGNKEMFECDPAPEVYIGRSAADSPDIDPQVYITGFNLPVGKKVPCEILAVSGENLVAVPANDQ